MIWPNRLPEDAVDAAFEAGGPSRMAIAAFLDALLDDAEAIERATRAGWPGLIDGPSNALTIHCARVRAALTAAVQVPA